MSEYVFIDTNNGHFITHHNFQSNATVEQINKIQKKMKHSKYTRMGNNACDLGGELLDHGFTFVLKSNPANRRYIDRIAIECIPGNY